MPAKTKWELEAEREAAVLIDVKNYCDEHPASPAARTHPRVMIRGSTYIALLGSTLEHGIAGIGGTVRAALRAFDVQYQNAPRSSR